MNIKDTYKNARWKRKLKDNPRKPSDEFVSNESSDVDFDSSVDSDMSY